MTPAAPRNTPCSEPVAGGRKIVNPNKLRAARLLDALGVNTAWSAIRCRWDGPHARAVNYHDTPPELAPAFEEQLRLLAARFEPVGPAQLRELLDGRRPRRRRPGLLLTFDDGLASHAEVAAPLLERHGFPGWFFVPVQFVDTPAAEQAAFAAAHAIRTRGAAPPRAMSWDQVRALDRGGHVIGCHTLSHRRLGPALGAGELDREIRGSRGLLESRLGHAVESFAWVGGEEASYSAAAAARIRAAGFRYAFMTNTAIIRPGADPLQLQRTNLEADYPAFLMRFQLAGLLDLAYAPKRRRVNRLTAVAPPEPPA